ncbi:DUF7302 family protein [Gordonia alkaliphila]|uniref:Head-to-tail connector protein n=1 Tax=Gordonia alkaliphila TaxID=1053547 RepID=A0ABP8ZH00_9ACTN
MKIYRNGAEADVPDEVAAKLVGEGWTKGKPRKAASKAAVKAPADVADDPDGDPSEEE